MSAFDPISDIGKVAVVEAAEEAPTKRGPYKTRAQVSKSPTTGQTLMLDFKLASNLQNVAKKA